MKYGKLLSMIIMFNFFNINAQVEERLNCMIFVDGKLKRGISGSLEFEYNKNSYIVKFIAGIGEIYVNEEDINSLEILRDKNIDLRMRIGYETYDYKKVNYCIDIKSSDLLSRYCIIRITNLNKRGTKYHTGVTSQIRSSVFIKKEYNMLEEYPRK